MEGAPEDSIENLLAKARKGAGAESGRKYIGDYLWARLWKSVTSIANCPPEINSLLMYRAEINACMKMAQEMQLDLVNAEMVTKRMKELFTAPIKMP